MKNREWIAFSCILGVIAGFVLTNTGADDREALAFWLVYAVTAGVVINTAEGLGGLTLLLGSLPSPLCMAVAILFRVHVQGAGFVSALEVTHSPLDDIRIGVIFLVSWAAIWVFSFARPAVIKVLRFVIGMPERRAKRIEARLSWTIKIVGLLALLAQKLIG